MKIEQVLSSELGISEKQVANTIELINQGNTIPFIARYRKEVTGNLSDEVLRTFDDRLKYLLNLEDRKKEILNSIEKQGKLTKQIEDEVDKAMTLSQLEDIYRPFKQKKKTRASVAKKKGLESFAKIILEQKDKRDIEEIAKTYLRESGNDEEDVKSVEEAITGAMDIIAEDIADNVKYRKQIKKQVNRFGVISVVAKDDEENSTYDMYANFNEGLKTITSHRILAINRGEKEGKLKVKIDKDSDRIVNNIKQDIEVKNSCFKKYIDQSIEDSYKRLIEPSIDREMRSDLFEMAEDKAIDVFGKNIKQLLLQPPIKNKVVLGFDPAFRTGCKIAIIDETGKLLDYTTIYPTEPQNDVVNASKKLIELIKKYNVNLIALGNGTASRESEQFISDCLKKIDQDVSYVIVSEAGASVYSASKLATEEYPDINVSIRGAISIARRLQDPLSELVKIDPKSIGVGQYQHDLNQKKLSQSLRNVVEDSVNSVGVDVNTATPSLLEYVAGINSTIAKNIVKFRDENGKIRSRKELLKVPKLGKTTFEQCAGFLRILDGENPLEITSVHPETYAVAEQLLVNLGFEINDLKDKEKINNIREKLKKVNIEQEAKKLNVGELTLKDIIDELSSPGRDVRDELPKPILRSDILKMEDLKEGMVLKGTVRNVIDFGAFVDIGIKGDGLVHISEMSENYIKSPFDVVSIGDVVNVKVIGIDNIKHKVKLSMKAA